ncbi:beta-ketoacyl-ACP synthase III [Streptacidiphilus sp. PB12-B1b]|uniref:3-oxoacyl-ACP synthase III family protein n=1 Tax=Streptacidiphilus sp. PB12-B1b TaxID=2705012 RepID=UPI0015FDCFC3|nr:beta-ketoacyl-ACP synthase 3 [Streptacidiphilus sp. PB12-B1b]QMU78051.1 beta-ketoacyl-ACP synthase III [Streptacidiphilus sp. PB12-B1b]
MTAAVVGVGAALPGPTVPNAHFERIGASSEWIVKRTGIEQRHFLEPGGRLADLVVAAAGQALRSSGVTAHRIRHVVVATITPDRVTPGVSVEVAARLGLPQAAAFDLHAACAGFVYGLDHAAALIETGRAEAVLVCGADALTRITDHEDRGTAVLLADGAGAVVVADVPGAPRPAFSLGSDGELIPLLYADRDERKLRMDGREIFAHAVEKMAAATREVLDRTALTCDDIDLFVAHQANARIVRAVGKEVGLPPERLYLNVQRVANTSAASIPLALAHAREEGRLGRTALLGLAAFGAGITWGAGVIGWQQAPDPAGEAR